ncbi:MAG: 6,7-dimethyl-8-ribityllumazine synthase [Candidatus Diapherotrites archaeon]|uniref:6,7-dimethyl-8-ribityllumazine synthase n=1 Tax=Candidatus Iainarchaeum sp. TaxID=3101447 RepID=A0A8T4L9D4_9ARCH|nr:6,7-dimethyl-8-ribityllumazine synthase [Candidatus Diapherotrites archaeon]
MGGKKMKIGLVVSEFNYEITQMMLQRAKEHAEFLGATVEDVVKVPGVYDMPIAVKRMLQEKHIEGIATLGAVIEGDTGHDEIVAQHAARKIMDLGLEFNKPVSLGISGPRMTRQQATERIDDYAKRSVETVVKMLKKTRAK